MDRGKFCFMIERGMSCDVRRVPQDNLRSRSILTA